ncbi:MAG: DegT/DnrJ/EryC1/StrS family aminotransferase [Actinobacteria bacterium]|nr:MAG: DegT/DnrJ/EryC1/StrS family aminotransferase [Actinomycetota bacterium]
MAIPLLDLKAQYAPIRPQIDEAIDEVISSAAFIGGQKVKRLEEEIAALCGTKHAVGCASGTDALILILDALGVGAGDEVITTPFTFVATAEAISQVGATPVFADIRPDTYSVDPAAIEAALTDRTRAIMPVHIFGQAAEMDEINRMAAEHGLFVVEDACQAIGGAYKGRPVGSLGHAAAFSFFPSKNLGCAGDGGAITTDDEALAAAMAKLRTHGTGKKYYHDLLGFNSRLDALQAAILLVKLPYLAEWNEARRRKAEVYDSLFEGTQVVAPVRMAEVEHVYHLYIVRSPKRDAIIEALKAAEIGSGVYYPVPLHRQEVYRSLGYAEGSLPVAEKACNETLALPLFPEIGEEQQREVAQTVLSALQ